MISCHKAVPFKRRISTDELHKITQKLYEVLNDWEPILILKARAQGSPFPWRSVKDLVKDLQLPKTYRSRTLVRLAKRALAIRRLVSFKRVFKLGELRADLFFVLDFKAFIQRQVIPSKCGVMVLTVVSPSLCEVPGLLEEAA